MPFPSAFPLIRSANCAPIKPPAEKLIGNPIIARVPCTLSRFDRSENAGLQFPKPCTYVRAYFAKNFAIFAWVNARVDAAGKTKGTEIFLTVLRWNRKKKKNINNRSLSPAPFLKIIQLFFFIELTFFCGWLFGVAKTRQFFLDNIIPPLPTRHPYLFYSWVFSARKTGRPGFFFTTLDTHRYRYNNNKNIPTVYTSHNHTRNSTPHSSYFLWFLLSLAFFLVDILS